MSAHQLKELANSHFSKRSWQKAINAYSKGIEVANIDSEAVVLRLNRAAAYLKSDRPGRALQDLRATIDTPTIGSNPTLKEKALYRMATAEYQLRRYSAAAESIENLRRLRHLSKDAEDLSDRIANRLRERLTGVYDWPTLYKASEDGTTIDVSDFAGSLSLRVIPGRGRGIMASRSIKAGELLLVENPFAVSRRSRERLTFIVGLNLRTNKPEVTAQVDLPAAIMGKLSDDPSRFDDIMALYAGPDYDVPPPPEWPAYEGIISRPGTGEELVNLDPSRIAGIATYNSFTPKSVQRSTIPEEEANVNASSAVYLV